MAIGSAPEIGATFVQLDTWEDRLAFLRQWRATVGDNGVGGYGTLVPRSEINGDLAETRNTITLPPTELSMCGVHEPIARDGDANGVDVAVQPS